MTELQWAEWLIQHFWAFWLFGIICIILTIGISIKGKTS